ncbi:unnamed protein product [Rotaria magnacalcarata]|uniref:Uncharacterized protein n=1 Tax=Rotaria magnacalcarata TaxID=392030 RepID=A0A818XKM5_9BILA|nr:unnamed protein product [Rotaria magnacalcarata]
MNYFQRVISIYDHLGLPHHQNVIQCHRRCGYLYRKQHDHQPAFACYEQAIFHYEKASLPRRHPLWVLIYTNSADKYNFVVPYNRALEEYENALQHSSTESLKISRIYNAMDVCRSQIIKADVHQILILMLHELEERLL